MKTAKVPTQGQFLGLWRNAVELGLDREMVESLVPEFTAQMKERRNQILDERDNCITVEISAVVNQNREFIEALEAATPNTTSSHNAQKVACLFPPISDKVEVVDFVLRNFPKGEGSWEKALAWAKFRGYKITNPREAFAVAEQHNLQKLLDKKYLYITVTTRCYFGGHKQAVYISQDMSGRATNVDLLSEFGGELGWFLFRK